MCLQVKVQNQNPRFIERQNDQKCEF
jgi:hypothetical protein